MSQVNRPELNTFLKALAKVCEENLLAPKWVIAPNRRVGYQWLDAVTRAMGKVFNARVTTLNRLALALSAKRMTEKGVATLRTRESEAIVAGLLVELAAKGKGYISQLRLSLSLVSGIHSTLNDLRLSGVKAKDLVASRFETPEKAAEISFILKEYERELEKRALVDRAGVLNMAREALVKGEGLRQGTLVIIPTDMELKGLARKLWEAIPAEARVELPVDEAPVDDAKEISNARLLGRIVAPAEAPAPKRDGTATMFRATGEVNEVREVLRRCLEAKLPLDEMEIVCADEESYVPLIYETIWHLFPDAEEAPVTFARGLPSWYYRPARALMAWLAWQRGGCAQSVLARMVAEKQLRLEGASAGDYDRLASRLRALRIGAGRDRYLEVADAAISDLKGRLKEGKGVGGEEGLTAQERERMAGALADLVSLRKMLDELISCLPGEEASSAETLDCAASFLEKIARRSGKMDESVVKGLLAETREMRECLAQSGDAGLDAAGWLDELAKTTRIGGLGPRPGRLYVSNIETGGHSGRKHLFVVGLDDARFPGAGLQDPFLLDGERQGLAEDIPLAAVRLQQRTLDLARLFARQRGKVSLSFSCRDLSEDRQLQPSPAFFSAFRILSGKHTAGLEAMDEWLGGSVSFTPRDGKLALDGREWWYWRLLAAGKPGNAVQAVARHYPSLGAGMRARAARISDKLTEYDGYVPEAGKLLDPSSKEGRPVSTNSLEKLAKIPMDFFFHYALGIELPRDNEVDPGQWLDPPTRGSLLHAVFRDFTRCLVERKEKADFEKHRGTLSKILEKHVQRYRGAIPPPGEDVFRYERRELERIAMVFLYLEEEQSIEGEPLHSEVAVAMEPEGSGTPLDRKDPVELSLPNGMKITARGKIDRLDALGATRYHVWDYKTGKLRGGESELYCQGRRLQCALYPMMAARLLEEKGIKASKVGAGYIHPAHGENGERVSWQAEQLADAGAVIAQLCELIASGCFIFTEDESRDVVYSDYRAVYGDAAELAAGVRAKLANAANKALEPFRLLRGTGDEGKNGKRR